MSKDYREYDPATLETLQRIELSMLKDFDALCRKHGIRYFADSGTAIGAVRHHGMIPWDDDIDLCLPREDYDRFLALAETEYGDKYYMLDAHTAPGYPLMTGRWCLRGTVFQEEALKDVDAPFGIFLDLYCLDALPDDEREARRQWFRGWFWGKLMILREVRSPVLYLRGFRASLVRAACFAGHYALRLFTTRAFLLRHAEKWILRCRGRKTKRVYYSFAPRPYRNSYVLDEVFPTHDEDFGGVRIPVSGCNDAYLRRIFGDYMTLPPPEKRHNHPPRKLDFGPYAPAADVPARP